MPGQHQQGGSSTAHWLRHGLWLTLFAGALPWMMTAGCAGTETKETDPSTSTATSSTGGGMGGSGGTSSTGGMGGAPSPCGTDCSLINTPKCQVAQCNAQTGQCEVVNDEEGVACDDGLFCTISDSCSMGTCVGGPQNDCGMAPAQCTEVTCDETSQTCSTMPSMNGAPCQDPNDLCLKGSTCNNGLCIGGMQDDCFFFPVPVCHEPVCNPNNGMCEPQVGPDNVACNDPNDLCTVDKTCMTGVCQGGTPKDCSQLTQGCFNGVCDTLTGQCNQVAIMPGGMCQEAADDCNNGVCDTMGMCNPVPTNNGGVCDDGDGCTSGTTCSNGVCGGGSQNTTCTNNDGCCPTGCTSNNDNDCGLVPGNTTNIVSRGGYQAQCTLWQGNVCQQMWVKMNEPDITAPNPHCIDDTTSLRPVWFGTASVQAPAICWIATGNTTVLSTGTGSSSGGPLCGWMYSGSTTACSGDRRYSTVNHPGGVGPITWSFDLMTFCRAGTFTFYECAW